MVHSAVDRLHDEVTRCHRRIGASSEPDYELGLPLLVQPDAVQEAMTALPRKGQQGVDYKWLA